MSKAYRKVLPKGCGGQVQIWGPDNRIDVPLTYFARELPDAYADTTARGYLNEVMRIHSWAAADPIVARQGWSLRGSTEAVRNTIEHFLEVEYGCEIRTRRDDTEQQYRRVKPSGKTPTSAAQLIAGLNQFYDMLRRAGLYSHRDPMQTEDSSEKIQEFKRKAVKNFKTAHGRPPMMPVSGVDIPLIQKRLTASYYRVTAGDWIPQVINDPDLPNHVYHAGERAGWGLREKCIARLLFEAGPRIHEVLAIDLADWIRLTAKNVIDVVSKGSNDARVKQLVFTNVTARMLRTYVNTERRECDEQKRRFADFERMDLSLLRGVPLFLSARGERMAVDTFRRCYWTPALRDYGLAMRIHQARHWFVTQELENIQKTAASYNERQTREGLLADYMHWRSGNQMLEVYGHVLKQGNALAMIEDSHRRMLKREKAFAGGPPPTAKPGPQPLADVIDQDVDARLVALWQEDEE